MATQVTGPLRFSPKLVSKIWGARRLESVMGKKLPEEGRYGESWEVSAHPGDETPVAYPEELSGRTIPELAAMDIAADVFGKHAAIVRNEGFPLLYKFIDADAVLSVQVHPDDDYARANEGDNGKTECWVVIAAQPGSILYKGFVPGTDLARFDELLAEGRVEECLNAFEVRAGDVVFIPARTVHAIGAGILLAEIQQSSDVTYRVYDWGRVGSDGKPRAIHVEQARDVMDFKPLEQNTSTPEVMQEFEGGRWERLAACDKFILERLSFDNAGSTALPTAGGGRFSILSVLDGGGALTWDGGGLEAGSGESFLVPACLEGLTVKTSGQAVVLNAYLPK